MRALTGSLALIVALSLLTGAYVVGRALFSRRDVLPTQSFDRCPTPGWRGGDGDGDGDGDGEGRQPIPPLIDQLIIVLVDALRPDFALAAMREPMAHGARCEAHSAFDATTTAARSTASQRQPAHLSYIEEALEEASGPLTSVAMLLVADSPTTTSQRLKAITTGGLPAFVEAGSNFNADAVREDSILRQLQSNASGGAAVVLGDDTWVELFGPRYWRRFEVFPSFDVRDLHSNDDLVLSRIYEELEAGSAEPVKLIIAHFLGVDHAGHRFDADNVHMDRKLEQVNVALRNISQKLHELVGRDGKRRMLLVFGDHGMTDSGDHGGGSAPETDTLLFAELFAPSSPGSQRPTGSGEESSQAHTATTTTNARSRSEFAARKMNLLRILADHRISDCESLDAALCELMRCSKYLRSHHEPTSITNGGGQRRESDQQQQQQMGQDRAYIQGGAAYQIDLAATISQLLGLPIPYSNTGRVLPELLLLALDHAELLAEAAPSLRVGTTTATDDQRSDSKILNSDSIDRALVMHVHGAMRCNLRQLATYFRASELGERFIKQRMHDGDAGKDGGSVRSWLEVSAEDWLRPTAAMVQGTSQELLDEYFSMERAAAVLIAFARHERGHVDGVGLWGGALCMLLVAASALPPVVRPSPPRHPPSFLVWPCMSAAVLAAADALGIVDAVSGGLWPMIQLLVLALMCCTAILLCVRVPLATSEGPALGQQLGGWSLSLFGSLITVRFLLCMSNSFIVKEVDAVHLVLQTLCAAVALAGARVPQLRAPVLRLWCAAAAIFSASYRLGVRERRHGTHIVAAASFLDEIFSSMGERRHDAAAGQGAEVLLPVVPVLVRSLCTMAIVATFLSIGCRKRGAPAVQSPARLVLLVMLTLVVCAVDGTVLMHALPIVAVLLRVMPLPLPAGPFPTEAAAGLAASWLVALAASSLSAQINATLMIIACAFLAELVRLVMIIDAPPHSAKLSGCGISHIVPQVTGILFHLTGWLMFFTMGQQCEASTLDWNAAFVGLHEYSMLLGGSLVFARTFAPFVVQHIIIAVAFPSADEPPPPPPPLKGVQGRGISPQGVLVFLSFCQVAWTATSLAKHSDHLMLWAIFKPKFIADVFVGVVNIGSAALAGILRKI